MTRGQAHSAGGLASSVDRRNSTAWVIGGGDSAPAILKEVHGKVCGVQVARSLAAFHAAKSKHAHGAMSAANLAAMIAGDSLELHPRFLVRSS